MPAEIDTIALLNHIDGKFADADRKRADGLAIVHSKIDDHAREARDSLAAFRTETTAALGSLSVEIGKHDTRLDAIEERESTSDAKVEGRMLAAAKIILSGGGLAALYEVLRGSAKP